MALLGNLTGSSQFFSDELFYNGVATQSLRVDDGSSPYLTKTFGSDGTGSGATCTVSCWVKRASISNNDQWFFTAGASSPAWILGFRTADTLAFGDDDGNPFVTVTDRVFRDTSAWYHIVLRVKTSESANADKYKIYVNGELQATTFSGTAADTLLGANVVHNVGRYPTGSSYFDGYMAEVNFVDGLALDPTYFGETKNGVWIPKAPNVSEYGTNGFRLQFDQVGVGTASTSTIGADTSGKTNHLTSSGIAASDCAMPDSPENNFCTLNPLDASLTSTTISEGNLQTNQNADSDKAILKATFGVSSGKWYWEGRVIYEDDSNINIGVVTDAATINSVVTADYTYLKQMENLMSVGDIFQIALNMDDGAWYIGLNNTWYNSATASEIAAGNTTNAEDTGLSGTFLPAFYENAGGSGTGYTANFGQDDTFAGAISSAGNTDSNGKGVFKYAPPSGFLALCTSNLPEPTISPNSATQADDYFNTVLYTGDGAASHAITGVGFSPDWVWGKKRSATGDNWVFDTSRGATKQLATNSTNAESTQTTMLKTFDSDGFTMGNDSPGNADGTTLVAWNWLANGGTATASGSESGNNPAYSVQANATAGFSIVTYTGTGSAGTVAHGLGAVPQMYIIKRRSNTGNWYVFHKDIGNTHRLRLDETSAKADEAVAFNDTSPTSSVFSIGTSVDVNADANTYVAYVFAEVEGYSKFGSYTGNSSADGTFIYLGFRPAFILWKRTTDADDWGIHDNTRDTTNVVENVLRPNLTNTEFDGVSCDFLSNGLKWRVNSGLRNTSGQTYIYMAFAEAPFKYANAR